jgi:hypothetical protein
MRLQMASASLGTSAATAADGEGEWEGEWEGGWEGEWEGGSYRHMCIYLERIWHTERQLGITCGCRQVLFMHT